MLRVRRVQSDKNWNKKQQRAALSAQVRAVTRTARKARAQVARIMAPQTGLRQKDIRAASDVKPASRQRPQAEIDVRGKPLNLVRFRGRMTRQGFKARPWGRTRIFKGVFVGNDSRTAFIRSKRKGGIRGAFGPGIAKEFGVAVDSSEVQALIRQTYQKEFKTSFDYLSRRAAQPARRKLR